MNLIILLLQTCIFFNFVNAFDIILGDEVKAATGTQKSLKTTTTKKSSTTKKPPGTTTSKKMTSSGTLKKITSSTKKLTTSTKKNTSVTYCKTKTVTVTASQLNPIQAKTVTVTSKPDRMVQLSGFVGDDKSGCDPYTSQRRNVSAAGWNVLMSRGDMKAGSCTNVMLNLAPSNTLFKATVQLECRGKAAFMKLISFNDWSKECPVNVFHGIVWSNGYNCSSRHEDFVIPYELSLTANACSNTELQQRDVTTPTLEFVSIFNIWNSTARGIGPNNSYTNLDVASDKSFYLSYGVQVMTLNSLGQLDYSIVTEVTLDLLEDVDSIGQLWGRIPKLNGVIKRNTVRGVASFGGDLGIPTSGIFRLRACATGYKCVVSPKIEVAPAGITKIIMISQPLPNSKQVLYDTKTKVSKLSIPINVTMADDFDNLAAQAQLLGKGFFDVEIHCSRAENDDFKIISTEQVLWEKAGFAEIWSFGDLKSNIDKVFGDGAVAGEMIGWKCLGKVNIGKSWQDLAKVDSLESNILLFS